jgi:transcriptional regulator with XRE-family HTH domain
MASPFLTTLYTPDTMIGRPPSKPAPPFGQRLAALRKAKGLSQVQLAELLSTTRKTVDYYERRAQNPSLEVITKVADALGVSAAELMGVDAPKPAPQRGPTGKLRQLFDDVARLPRRQQEKIAEFVSAYVRQYEQERDAREGR